MRQLERFDPAVIAVPKGRRPVDAAAVARLRESIQTIGLRTPITVRLVDNFVDTDGVVVDGQPILVTGAHRLAAAKEAGLSKIECFIFDEDNELEAKRWEIAENLHRAELTQLERSEHVAQWIALTEQAAAQAAADSEQDVRHSVGGKPGQNVQVSRGGRGKKSGLSQAARELNIPGKTEDAKRKNAERAVKVASISEEAKAVAVEVGLDDNRSALLQAAAAPTEQQSRVLRDIAARKESRESVVVAEDVSWTADGQPSREQLVAIRTLDDSELCDFLLRVEGVGLIAALRRLKVAA